MRFAACRVLLPLAAALLASGCSLMTAHEISEPPARPDLQLGNAIAGEASVQVGRPYRYGGETPAGFDCSGLAYFTHRRAGIPIPRTALDQSRAAVRVQPADLEPGDLVFFRIDGRRVDHVGIYLGGRRFIHAPRTGRPVTYADLNDTYYLKHFAGAGRFW